MKKYNLLIVDDDPIIRQLLELKSTHYGFRPKTALDGFEAIELLHDQLDVILLDLDMPKMDGFATLMELKKIDNNTPVVILSGEHEAEAAIKAVKLGAMDYICKPFDLDDLFTKLRNAKKVSAIQKENTSLKETIAPNSVTPNLISNSIATKAALKKAQKVAKINSTILLSGESGTGKGMFARFIHANSDRADKPFVTVSCPALPRELLESELFGHEKGAFTGAVKRRIGKIEAAQGGTLFLDEIGDLPIDLQPKLLNVLQDQEFTRVGGELLIKSDVRIIAASNIDFEEKILHKEFREDLYYRLSVIPIELPPLRERSDEIVPLAEYFASRIAKSRGLPGIKLTEDTKKALREYRWPGNVRQLENLVERSSAFCENNIIKLEDLSGDIMKRSKNSGMVGLAGHTLAEIETESIIQTLKLCNGNKAESARQLGITEKSIYNKMKRLNITL